MTKTELKWKLATGNSKPAKKISKLPLWFLQILTARGLDSEQAIGDFLSPDYDKIASPESFLHLEEAVVRIKQAREGQERVVVYGDYDVDGITATAVVYETLSKIGIQNVESYIPHREEEGYGLNSEALTEIAKNGATLVIAVDCGITSGTLLNVREDLDFIVIDHHTIDEEKLPKKGVILHPSLTVGGEIYHLSAAGMAFIFALGLQRAFPEEILPGQEKWLLDLVALSTICDIVPLTGTNRLLAHFGLIVLNKTKREGLKALMEVSGVETGTADAYTVGFLIGPRLNAAGRLESAQTALRLLLTKDKKEATELAHELNRLNSDRQLLCQRIVDEAQQQAEAGDSEAPIHLLSDKDWPRGVVGIVASRIADYYNRPAIIFEDDGEFHHGSARSVEGLNIMDLLSETSDYLVKYGGHAKAAGLTVSHEHFVLFKEKLLALADEKIKEVELERELIIDAEIKPEEIDDRAMELLGKMEPTGFGNKRPILMISGAEIGDVKRVGKGKEHLKFNLKVSADSPGNLSAVAFSEPREIEPGKKYDLAFTLKYNIWNNHRSIDLRIADFREA